MAQVKKLLQMYVFVMMLALWPMLGFAVNSSHAPSAPTPSGKAENIEPLSFQTSLHGDYARITMKAKEMPFFDMSQKGNKITINFESPYQASVDAITNNLQPFIKEAVLSKDGKTLTLTTDKNYGHRPFMSDDGSGLDILNIDPKRAKPAPKETAKAPPSQATKEEKAKDVRVVNENSPETKSKNDRTKASDASPTADKVVSPVSINKNEMTNLTSESFKNALKNLHDGDLLIGVRKGHGGVEFRFPFNKRVASAVYMRGDNNMWIVFNEVFDPHLDIVKTVLPPIIDDIEHIPTPNHTVLRIHSNLNLNASAHRARDSYEWIITMSRRGQIPATLIPVTLKGLNIKRPYFQVDVLQAAEPVEIKDSVVGDTLLVLPDYEPSEGVFPPRSFVDFKLLRTAQGVVVERINDAVQMSKLREGIKISAGKQLLNVSDELPELAISRAALDEENANTFFPYEHWKQMDHEGYVDKRQQLQSEIAEATNEDALKYRMQLAGLSLGNDMYPEALGQLNAIKAQQPQFYDDYQLAALRGATNFMLHRYADAAADFADASLENEDEITFWNNATKLMLGTGNNILNYIDFHGSFAKLYPPRMRQQLAMLAIDQALTRARFNEAKKILTILANETTGNQEEVNPYLRDYIDYVTGRLYASNHKLADAKKVLGKILETTNNPYFYMNASYVLALAEYEANEITRKDLIKKLDRLRIVWRGDSLEVALLNLLGDLQIQEGMNVDGMRTWNELVKQYPDAPETLDVAQKMAETFVKLFVDGEADTMKPLEALALYYEFQTLTPVGKDGDKMIQNLADRLASVDLLDRAAALLSYQIKYRLDKEERSRVGARLALLYLLNKEPDKTLEALKLTGFGNNPEALNLQRAHLSAEAYRQLKLPETALKILDGDFSHEAKSLKLDIYWDNKDWQNVAQTAEDLLASREDITAPLNDAEAQTLLRLGVAYTFLDDLKQLNYLKDYFTPLMDKNKLKDSFQFIVNDNGPITHNSIDKLSGDLNKMKLFIEKYQKEVHNTGLSKTVK